MNLLNDRRLILGSSIFLTLVVFLYFALQFFQEGEVADLLSYDLKQLTSTKAMTFGEKLSSDMQLKMSNTNDFPSFKIKRNPDFDINSNSEINFPNNSNFEAVEPRKKTVDFANYKTDKVTNSVNYNSAQNKSEEANTSANRDISSKTSTFHSNNTVHTINNEIHSLNEFGNSQSFSNMSSNSFLANNTLTIATDLSEYGNSPMLVDGGSNPGDPGIPVGEGTWILLSMALVYIAVVFRTKIHS